MRSILSALMLVIAFALAAPAAASAATYYVSSSGSGTACSQAAPCSTFQAASNLAQSGDEVLVTSTTLPSQKITGPQRSAGPPVVFRPANGPLTTSIGSIDVTSADYVRFEGFKLSGSNDIIDNSTTGNDPYGVEYVGNELTGSTIWMDHSYNTRIEDNYIHDGPPTSSTRKIGIRSISDNGFVFKGNHITRFVEDPIQVDTPVNGLIEGNELSYAYPQNGEHTDCIQVLGADGLTIRNNHIHHTQHCFMFTNFQARDVTIENNLVHDIVATGVKLDGTNKNPNIRMVNNTFWRSGTAGVDLRTSHPGGVFANNVFDKVSALGSQPVNVKNVVTTNASVFEDTVDFVPAEGGPLHNTGSATYATATDWLGVPRDALPDIGAVERVGVAPPPDEPAVAAWTAPSDAIVGTPVTLDGSASTGDGALSCSWQFESAEGVVSDTRSGCSVSYTFSNPGTKYVRLVVTDADGDTDNLLRSFEVTDPDIPAFAAWTHSPATKVIGQPVTLDASGSTGNGPMTYLWKFMGCTGASYPDGVCQTREGQVIQFTFQSRGTKDIELVVTDADGDVDTERKQFTVG